MAHDLKTRAAAITLFATGMGITDVAKTLKVPKTTVQVWHKEWQEKTGESSFEIKRQQFADSLADYGIATMNMLIAQAEMLSDNQYVKNLSTEDVIKHTGFIRDSLITLNQAASFTEQSALPDRIESVEGIPVEESSEPNNI